MIKIFNIIGARPQIIKASAICREIKNNFSDKIEDIVIHTGQHYDESMSGVFFNELQITEPRYNLAIGSGMHGAQTAAMISGIEELILQEKPDCIVVYGDTNSTLAAAVAASKLHYPLAHIEAGLRSFNKKMPEEINRIMCDHASTLLFTPTKTGLHNLMHEGFKDNKAPFNMDNPGIFHCGDVMYDNSLYFSKFAEQNSSILKDHNLIADKYILLTIHRNNNTDIPERLQGIFNAINTISKQDNIKFIVPLHPRTSNILQDQLGSLYYEIINNPRIKISAPASFLEMIVLEKNAKLVMTDSGGVQKEAFFFQKPCIILRDETEWVELVENGVAWIAGADTGKILSVYKNINYKSLQYPAIFGDGKAAQFICSKLIENF